MKCKYCGGETEDAYLRKNYYICPECKGYFRMPLDCRIDSLVDKNSFIELFQDLEMDYSGLEIDYVDKLKSERETTGLNDAVKVGYATICGEKLMICVNSSQFMMGSMGYIVGEKITRAIEIATEKNLPIVIVCASGGARVQEGMISLMQMEKTAAALARYSEKNLLYISVLTDPTAGGVTASYGMLGDIIMAEKGAYIGFAGKRVIRQTIGEELPKDFQTAKFQEFHGMVDGVVERKRIRKLLMFFLKSCKRQENYSNFDTSFTSITKNVGFKSDKHKNAYAKVKASRGLSALQPMDYVNGIFDIFVELNGDRLYGNDKAIAGGLALLHGQPVMVISSRRGRTAEDIVGNNFGMPSPEGYRKSLRLMKLADKYNLPIITFINTSGAFPGSGAEERGQGEAIARNLYEISKLSVPILAIIVGEAGSGGALALAVANEVWMLSDATYSVLSPEGYASIVWKDSSRAGEAADKMKMEAEQLITKAIIDKIVHIEYDYDVDITNLKIEIMHFLECMDRKTREEIMTDRYARFRKF